MRLLVVEGALRSRKLSLLKLASAGVQGLERPGICDNRSGAEKIFGYTPGEIMGTSTNPNSTSFDECFPNGERSVRSHRTSRSWMITDLYCLVSDQDSDRKGC